MDKDLLQDSDSEANLMDSVLIMHNMNRNCNHKATTEQLLPTSAILMQIWSY